MHKKPNLRCVAKMYLYWQQLDAASAMAAEVKYSPADMDLSMGFSYTSLDSTSPKNVNKCITKTIKV
jgi:hypothetical protein